MFFYLVLLFVALPLVELALLLKIHSHVGLLATLAIVFGTGVLGASLARWQGLRTIVRIREEMAAGKMPADAMVDGLLILVAGAVLITPGVLTDAFGFALLIPPIRTLFKRLVRRWFERSIRVQTVQYSADGTTTVREHDPRGRDVIVDAKVIDTHVVEEEEKG